MILRSVIAWCSFVVGAIANGVLREFLLTPRLGPKVGHIASTLLLCAFILILAWLLMPWIGLRQSADAWSVGAFWLSLMLGFEFLVGHYVFRNSWEKLSADYNILRGRIWGLVPIITLFAPKLALVEAGIEKALAR